MPHCRTRAILDKGGGPAHDVKHRTKGRLTAGAVVPDIAGNTRAGYATATLLVAPVIVLTIWGMLVATRRAPTIAIPATEGFGTVLRRVASNRPFAILTIL